MSDDLPRQRPGGQRTMQQDVKTLDCSRIAQDLQIRKVQVENVVQLLDEGNTVPFITRYRKERTGGLNEEIIRQIQMRVGLQRQLADRKKTILKSIENQGKLTDDLRQAILKADTGKRLEDLYLPYKPKKRTLATTARERGLEPLALAVWNRELVAANLAELLPGMVNPEKELGSVEDVKIGVQHILAEIISETAEVRACVRSIMWETGVIVASRNEKASEEQGKEYKDYFNFKEDARKIPAHRILALNRGKRSGVLKLKLEWNGDRSRDRALSALAQHYLYQWQSGLPQLPTGPVAATGPAPSEEVETTTPENATSGGGYPDIQPADIPTAGEVSHPSTEAGEHITNPPPGTEPALESAPEMAQAAHDTAPPQAPEGEPATGGEPTPYETPAIAGEPAPGESPTIADEPAPAEPTVASSPPAPAPQPWPVTDEGEELSAGMPFRSPHNELLRAALDDALNRLIYPSLEKEIFTELREEAETHAVHVFACNLRSLLLQRPIQNCRVLAVDPGFRTGCKLAALDEYGNLLEHSVIFPHEKRKKKGKEDRGKEKPPAPEQPLAATPEPAPTPEPVPEAGPTDVSLAATGEIAPQEHVPVAEGAAPEAQETAPPVNDQPATEESAEETPPQAETPPVTEQPATEGAAEETTPQTETPPADTAKETADHREVAKAMVEEFVKRHNLNLVAIGNGTACRETEEFFAELIGERMPSLEYVIVNEAGASVYSASPQGREEFPEFDATLRGTISIGRRLQDPLAELVKVDPQNIGVGLYQHDVNNKQLKESLEGVVESCVNQVGVDLNTASVPLLRHVAGLNNLVAREIADYRKNHGPFKSREQLMQVPGLGSNRYTQAAGFLKIYAGDNPLDMTWIHPESYDITNRLLGELGYDPNVLQDGSRREELQGKLKGLSPEDLARKLDAGVPTVHDIIESLIRPGRDPREDLPLPVFKKGILKLDDLQPGMELRGTVLNVVDFGIFVDIGLKDSGLVHISQIANRFIKNPYDVVAVGDIVNVWVLGVDNDRRRVSLTMIQPGTEKKPEERRPSRPPRERRPSGPPRQPEGAAGAAGTLPSAAPDRGPRRGPPDRGRGPGPGRGHGRDRRPDSQSPVPSDTARAAPAPPPPRRPRREPPKPKLSKAALEGKESLRSFGELSAFFAAKKEPPRPPEPEVKPEPPQAETPPPAAEEANPHPEAASAPPPEQVAPQEVQTPPEGGDNPKPEDVAAGSS
jgi:transcriptional accessory protein Tex/SPT6